MRNLAVCLRSAPRALHRIELHHRAACSSRQRGAALVEYSLILAALVIGLLGVLQGVEDESQKEVASEFNCVSERPPPTDCLKRAVTTTTTTTIAATTSTSAPVVTSTSTSTSTTSSTTSTTTPPASEPTQAGWYYTTRRVSDGYESVATYFVLQDGSGQPLGNRTVKFEVRNQADGIVATGTCTTNGGNFYKGLCGVGIAIPSGTADVRVVATEIGGTPTMAPPPGGSPWV